MEKKRSYDECRSMFMERYFPQGIKVQEVSTDYKNSKEYLKLKSIVSDLVSFEDEAQDAKDPMELFKSIPIIRFHFFTLVTDILRHEPYFIIKWNFNRKYQSFDEFMLEVSNRGWFQDRVTRVLEEINDRVVAYIRGYYENEELDIKDDYGRTLSNMLQVFGKALSVRSNLARIKIAGIQDMMRIGIDKDKIIYSPVDLVVGLYYWFDYNKGREKVVLDRLLDDINESSLVSIKTLYNSYSKFSPVQKVAFMSYLIKDTQISHSRQQGVAYFLGQYILEHSQDEFDKILVQELMLSSKQFMTRVSVFVGSLPYGK